MILTNEAIDQLVKGMDGKDVLVMAAAIRARNLTIDRDNQVIRDDRWVFRDFAAAAEEIGCLASEVETSCRRGTPVGGYYFAIDDTLV